VNGHVDDVLRALLEISTKRGPTGPTRSITVWIDTAFNGYLVFPRRLIAELDLEQEAATDAVLADGTRVTLESYVCYVDWFGSLVPAQVIANDGSLPLLGTAMLVDRVLLVDYGRKRLSLE
jgi:clan AA aspartic protease